MMNTNSTDDVLKLPNWLVRLCKNLWGKRSLVGSTIILGLILNCIASLLFVDPSTFNNLSIHFVFRFWWVFLILGIALWVLTIFVGLIARLGASSSANDVKRSYLHRMEIDNQVLALKGIPGSLFGDRVNIDEVFIPLQLRPNRPRTDYPLKEQELALYQKAVASGKFSKDLDRLVLDAEKNWQYILKKTDRISIADMWNLMSDEQPVAVIQGYPGMGKSTLMERLTLHMARRGLQQKDPDMPDQERFATLLIPILIRLGTYAKNRKDNPALSLSGYIKLACDDLKLPDGEATSSFVQKSLADGACLVMLDGLDEVSEHAMRLEVQAAIRTFVQECRDKAGNRFFITSRVAGYDLDAFPDYPHYTLAELEDEQIDYFLPRWSRATIHRFVQTLDVRQKGAVEQAVEKENKELHDAIYDNPQVRELAENPLLLALLVVMKQSGTTLPRQRVELYRTVTTMLLESRNLGKNLPAVSEYQAIKLLSPLAFQMQDTGNNFAREKDVVDSLRQTLIITNDGTDAEKFLKDVRERGGLFVRRTGDYFSFMHRTFQEYFAARYMLDKIKLDKDSEIKNFVERAREQDEQWHVPFVLAVAYQSTENEYVASDMIRALLQLPAQCDVTSKLRYLLLATECIVEAKQLTIDSELERQVAEQLLSIYMEMQRQSEFKDCQEIENAMVRWLLSLPPEIPNRPLLQALL